MPTFEYRDRNGQNDLSIEATVYADAKDGTIFITAGYDGDSYTVYVPNHRAAVLELVSELMDVLDATDGWPQGYDGFSTNYAYAAHTGEDLYDDEEIGVVKHY